MVAQPGLEPGNRDPNSRVLPLHYRAMKICFAHLRNIRYELNPHLFLFNHIDIIDFFCRCFTL